MPLSLFRHGATGAWQIVGTVAGQRIRQSARTSDRRLAEEAKAELEASLYRGAVYGSRAVVTWDQAVNSYLDAAPRSAAENARLLRLLDSLTGKRLSDITQATIDRVIQARCRPGAQPATKLREVITPIRAVLAHAARRQWCDMPNFEAPKGASGVKRTRWLTPAEADALTAAAAPHLAPLILFLLGTGARLSEALALQWADLDLTHGRALLRQTKQGRDRVASLPPRTVAALANLPHREGHAFRPPAKKRGKQPLAYADTGGLYGGQIASAWRGACKRAGIADASPHTLRHTWASWHYAMHRDLMRLKSDGDWSTVSQTERYTKLVPGTMAPEIRKFLGLTKPTKRAAA
jgi:integrase